MITDQERNNNRYLDEELGAIRRVASGYISIIDAGIQLSHLTGKLLYYSQSDVSFIPHGTIMPIYKCEPTPGQLFTNSFGGPPDWVMSPEGWMWPGGNQVLACRADDNRQVRRTSSPRVGVHQTTHSGVFDLGVCEWSVW